MAWLAADDRRRGLANDSADHSVAHRVTAILAADVVGYSRLIAEDNVVALEQLKSLRATVIDPLVPVIAARSSATPAMVSSPPLRVPSIPGLSYQDANSDQHQSSRIQWTRLVLILRCATTLKKIGLRRLAPKLPAGT
ncbi:MAG: hypothetical protein ACKVOI_09720 [Dongiaceae bacterium]